MGRCPTAPTEVIERARATMLLTDCGGARDGTLLLRMRTAATYHGAHLTEAGMVFFSHSDITPKGFLWYRMRRQSKFCCAEMVCPQHARDHSEGILFMLKIRLLSNRLQDWISPSKVA